MNPLKILFVEDDKEQQETFRDDIEVFQEQPNNVSVDFVIVENVREAVTKIDESYDGAIIDLHLDGNDQGGNEIVQNLHDEFSKVPIIFVTSFADSVNHHPSVINIRRREDGSYHGDLSLFLRIRNSGLTHIIGRKGLIEEQLREVYLNNLLPQIKTWNRYGEADPERTEKALLRYTLNHLYQHLEEGKEPFFPEEVYLYPPGTDKVATGSMVKKNDQWFVVLSPACDLVPRGENSEINTDHILTVEIERIDKILGRSKVKELCSNKRTYYHWLPETDFFEGGVLNFRKLTTWHKDEFDQKFGKPTIQISPFFIKDIVSRFSSYYARQGQPEIDNKDFIDRYTS